MTAKNLKKAIIQALEDGKATDIKSINIGKVSDFADDMIICSGQSKRQVKALADRTLEALQKASEKPIGVEGLETNEWILIDVGYIVVHIMFPPTREFYALEKLWEIPEVKE